MNSGVGIKQVSGGENRQGAAPGEEEQSCQGRNLDDRSRGDLSWNLPAVDGRAGLAGWRFEAVLDSSEEFLPQLFLFERAAERFFHKAVVGGALAMAGGSVSTVSFRVGGTTLFFVGPGFACREVEFSSFWTTAGVLARPGTTGAVGFSPASGIRGGCCRVERARCDSTSPRRE